MKNLLSLLLCLSIFFVSTNSSFSSPGEESKSAKIELKDSISESLYVSVEIETVVPDQKQSLHNLVNQDSSYALSEFDNLDHSDPHFTSIRYEGSLTDIEPNKFTCLQRTYRYKNRSEFSPWIKVKSVRLIPGPGYCRCHA